MVQRGVVKLQYVVTEVQIADVLTKPLARLKGEAWRSPDRGFLQEKVMRPMAILTW